MEIVAFSLSFSLAKLLIRFDEESGNGNGNGYNPFELTPRYLTLKNRPHVKQVYFITIN